MCFLLGTRGYCNHVAEMFDGYISTLVNATVCWVQFKVNEEAMGEIAPRTLLRVHTFVFFTHQCFVVDSVSVCRRKPLEEPIQPKRRCVFPGV